MTAIRRNNLYYLQAEVVVGSSCIAEDDSLNMWHMSLGHVGERGIKELLKRGLINGSDPGTTRLCESCLLGKK